LRIDAVSAQNTLKIKKVKPEMFQRPEGFKEKILEELKIDHRPPDKDTRGQASKRRRWTIDDGRWPMID
jgi:hypothetical protein